MGVGELGCGDDFLVGRIELAVTDVVRNGTGEEMCILKNDTERVTQVVLFDLVNVYAVVTDLAVLDIVEPVDEVRDGSLAGTRRSDESDLLSGLGEKLDIEQYLLLGNVAEVHAVKHNVALELYVIRLTACLMEVLPSPATRALLALLESVRAFAGIDEGNITVIGLGLLVEKLEDPVGTRE